MAMNCIRREGKTEHINLFTHVDKVKKLEEYLHGKRHKTDLFLPDDAFYRATVEPNDPEHMADQIFGWLEIKHRSLTISIDSNQDALILYEHTKSGSTVTLGWRCQEDSMLCGAAVAHAIIHHLLVARAKISLGNHEEDEALTDLGTIHAGLGILILNSFTSKQHILGSMGLPNYGSEFIDFCNQHRIVSGVWQPYIMPTISEQYLSAKNVTSRLKPYILNRVKNTYKRKRILYASAGFLALLVGVFVFIVTSKPASLSAEMVEKRDNISVLKAQVEQCQEVVKRKENTWDQSDIFIQRQIEADKTRCTSLTNRYNFEVGQYNSAL